MITFCIAIALAIVIVISIVLGVIVVQLNRAIEEYKTAACLSMGKLGRQYREFGDGDFNPRLSNLKQNLWDIWRAMEVYVPKEDLDVISNCFYKE